MNKENTAHIWSEKRLGTIGNKKSLISYIRKDFIKDSKHIKLIQDICLEELEAIDDNDNLYSLSIEILVNKYR